MNIIKKYLGLFLLAVAMCIGLFTFKDYGISWDEEQQHNIGLINYAYIFGDEKSKSDFNNFKDKDYGVAFELPLIFAEKILKLTDSRDIYLTRHLITHLFFLLSSFFCFLLVDLIYQNKLLASAGFFLILLNPSIYGHSFFNSKDIPFMCMILISFYLIAQAFMKKNILYFILLGVSIALSINLRIMGILLFILVLLFIFIDFIQDKEDTKSKTMHIYFALTFIFSTATVLYISWPYLWTNPAINFITAFKNMSKFRYNGYMLFNGEIIEATKLKWYYSIVWFSITNPIFYLLAGIFGIVLFICNFFKSPLRYLQNNVERNNLLYLLCFTGPIIAVIVLNSVLYNGWRQLYFIYPPFVLLIIYGLDFLLKTKLKNIITGGLFVTFITVAYVMITNFPLQHIYFNKIVSHNSPEYLRKQFDIDYWGTSFKQALEYILKYDNSDFIRVDVDSEPGFSNKLILKPEERKRILFADRDHADYFITIYRLHPEDFTEYKDYELYSIKRMNNSISTIFKLK